MCRYVAMCLKKLRPIIPRCYLNRKCDKIPNALLHKDEKSQYLAFLCSFKSIKKTKK